VADFSMSATISELLIGFNFTMNAKTFLALSVGISSIICPLSAFSATGEQTTVSAKADVSTASIDAKAEQILKKMSDFYGGMKTFKTVMVYTISVQKEKKESRTTNFKILAEKPNKLAIAINGDDKSNGGVVAMDGKNRYLYTPRAGYIKGDATSNFTGSFKDREFAFTTGFNFGGQSLLEALLADAPYQFIQRTFNITSAKYVGADKIDGFDVDHIQVGSKLDWDIWIDRGSKPWVRRVSPSLGKMVDDSSLTLVFNYTDLSDGKLSSDDFKFTAPKDAKLLTTFFSAPNPTVRSHDQPHALLNQPAPPITLDTIGGGKLDLASYKSKNVVVLDFWATWCPPCRQALPILAEVTKNYESKGVKFFAVDLREEPGKIEAFLKSEGLLINVALDKDGAVAKSYQVEGIPQSVIIGTDGVVKVVHVGFGTDLKTRLASELDAILSDKPVP